MEDAALANSLGGVDFDIEWYRVLASKPLDSFRSNTMSRGHSKHIPVDNENRATQSRTDADPASGYGLEDRLHVCRRATNHPKDLTGRGLTLQSLLRLVEQANILDGDDGLTGEGLEEGNLLLGERPGNTARDADGADSVAV